MTKTVQYVDLVAGGSVTIGDTTVTLEKKSGQRARLAVCAPRDLVITRSIQPSSAHECVSSPEQGKEQSHGQYPV